MKHLFNGDAAADAFAASEIDGEVIVWREALQQGPCRDLPPAEWLRSRASFIAESSGVDQAECHRALSAQEEQLRHAAGDELVIWVEGDLSCQLTVAYVARRLLEFTSSHAVALISVNELDGRPGFRGVGELGADDFRRLFAAREMLNEVALARYAAAWRLYASASPFELARSLDGSDEFHPHLAAALRSHVRRFPPGGSALGSVERAVLGALADRGTLSFSQLFAAFWETEPLLGFGDTQLRFELRRMEAEEWVTIRRESEAELVTATSRGADALAGRSGERRQAYWLGGAFVKPGDSFDFAR